MPGVFKRLLGSNKEPPLFDIEKAVGNFLLNYLRYTSKIVVVSPKYGDKNYCCEIIVEASGLLSFFEYYAKRIHGGPARELAALKALPFWFRDIDLSNPSPSYFPGHFTRFLRSFLYKFIQKGVAEVVCSECQRVVDDITKNKFNESRSGNYSWWTDEWHCQNGHLFIGKTMK
jgi:hypothetical protein